MDERSAAWLALLPSDAAIHSDGLPPALVDALGDRVRASGGVWAGWKTHPSDLAAIASHHAAVLLRPVGITPAMLRARGFDWVHAYSVAPTLADARWYIPLGNARASAQAWGLYAPYSRRARLLKRAARLASRMVGADRLGDRLIIAHRGAPSLIQALARMTGAPGQFTVAMAPHWPGARFRVTMQLVDGRGVVLAYAKLGSTPAACAMIRREAEFVDYVNCLGLETVAALPLLGHELLDQGYMMVSAPAPDDAGASGVSLTPRHLDALAEFSSRPGSVTMAALLGDLRRRRMGLQSRISTEWRERFERAMTALDETDGLAEIGTTLAHGDFAPWNIRFDPSGTRLVLFDWERGRRDSPPLWDGFHFLTQIDLILKRQPSPQSVASITAAASTWPATRRLGLAPGHVAALHVAYLLESCLLWFEEHCDSAAAFPPHSQDQSLRAIQLDEAVRSLRQAP
jgi:hypothetical protein